MWQPFAEIRYNERPTDVGFGRPAAARQMGFLLLDMHTGNPRRTDAPILTPIAFTRGAAPRNIAQGLRDSMKQVIPDPYSTQAKEA